jgi:hypothetical protein
VYILKKLYTVLQEIYVEIIRGDIMAKNKPAFQSNNSKPVNGQVSKSDNKTVVQTPKKATRGSNRGK